MEDINELLLKKLVEFGLIDKSLSTNKKEDIKKQFATEKISAMDYSILMVRDALLGLGTILEENLEKQYYMTTIKVGFLGAAESVALVYLNTDVLSVAAYAKEGLIPQHNAQKAIDIIKKHIK